MEDKNHRPTWKTLLAFAIIYFVWGSTFLAIRVGVHEVPPFLFAAMRFVVAGLILCGWMFAHGERSPSAFEWRSVFLLALLICALSIPLWAFGSTITMLALGSFVMQFGVQGAFGVIPAHLNELSPSSVRSLFPGVVYKLGVLVAAPSVVIEYALRKHFGYQWALTIFEVCVIFCLFLIFGFGPERKGHDFHA